MAALHRYAIALGSNRPLRRAMGPVAILKTTLDALDADPAIRIVARSAILRSRPLGPSQRDYANAAAVIATPLGPERLLDRLQALETHYGRRHARRWGERTLDLDILLWSGGRWRSRRLCIPHSAMDRRCFVLVPLMTIAPRWRSGAHATCVTHLAARLAKPRPARNMVDPRPSRH